MAKANNTDASISLNKYIRDSGLCSRREADEYIAQGRVTLNGEVAQVANRVLPGDVVSVDGEKIKSKKKPTIILLNKPPKTIVVDEFGKADDLISQINNRERLFAVDPLDKSSEGLVILTNDGSLATRINKMTQLENEYVISVDKTITDDTLIKMSQGVRTAGKTIVPLKVTKSGPSTLKLILQQGQSKYARAVCLSLGYKVKKIRRTKIHHLALKEMPSGQWRVISPGEVEGLLNAVATITSPKPAKRTGSFKSYREKAKTGGPKPKSKFAANRKRVKKR